MTTSALRSERGAVMVIAVFLAVFVLGLLYYVVGISETLFFREHMQDTADSAALSGAVMHARSMNLLVLINIVMAALLAILVTIKLIEGLAIIGMVIAAALAWFTGGSSLAAVPPLKVAQSNMDAAYQQVQPPIFAALEALHEAADVVTEVAPLAADASVLADITANAEPPGSRGVAAGTRLTLPVNDDSFSTLCGQAGKFPISLAKDALGKLPAVPQLLGALQDPMQDMTSSLSEWFCGDGGSNPPSYRKTEDRAYPRTDLAKACEAEHPDASGDLTLGGSGTSPTCEKSLRFEQAALPDTKTGQCSTNDCSLNSPYEQKVALARVQCDPESNPRPFYYLYQTRKGSVPYQWNGKAWLRLDPTYETPLSQHAAQPPCGSKMLRPSIAVGYEKTVRHRPDLNELLPVCSNEIPPPVAPRNAPLKGQITTVAFLEVSQILGCKRHEVITVQVSNGKAAGSDSNGKAPKRVEEGDSLGDENFQIRALIKGNFESGGAEQLVRLSLWNRAAPAAQQPSLRELGQYSFAQSEYFYDGTEGRDEWMWNMKWRARLHRFRLPTGDASKALQTACGSALGAACGSITNSLARLGDVVAH